MTIELYRYQTGVGACGVTGIKTACTDRHRSGVLFHALYYMAWYPRRPGSGGGTGREIDGAHTQAGCGRENSRKEGRC